MASFRPLCSRKCQYASLVVAKPSGTLTPKGESSRIISPREAFFPTRGTSSGPTSWKNRTHLTGSLPFLKASFSTPSALSPA